MKRWIIDRLTPNNYNLNEGIEYWKEYIFLRVLFLFLIFGGIAYGFGVVWSIQFKYYLVAGVVSIAYCSILLVIIFHQVPLKIKYYVVTYMALFLGVSLLISLGTDGAGFIYLIGYSILAALLFGLRGAVISVIVNLLVILFIGLGLWYNIFDNYRISLMEPSHWFVLSFNILPMSAVASIPLALVVKGLKQIIDSLKALQRSLEINIEQLNEAKEKAEESDHLKSMFLANISHEVRTPLNAILGYSELLMNEMVDEEQEKKKYYRIVFQNGQYLLEMIDNLLDASLIESHQLTTHSDYFQLGDLIEEIKNLYKSKKNGENVELRFVENLFSCSEVALKSDRKRIKQILINLINNAYKFTFNGLIEVGYDDAVDFLLFYVKDTGIGIPEVNKKHIFRRFVKVDQLKGGAGLGLSISKSLIESLGGKIWFESTEGTGTTFFFSLPKKQEA
nr:HAMP domain-containing sensor histidine kinase [uncultured Carboxylicivirga sp.]